jgi:prepilin-type N-terminal cleavage/methylation domain-containing protein
MKRLVRIACTRPSQPGFTLVELSVVLVIISLVTGMGIVAALSAIESSRQTATEMRLNEIEKALMAFRVSYNRLPCPSDNTLASANNSFGLEGQNPGVCNDSSPASNLLHSLNGTHPLAEGGVPVRALGLPNEFANDGWGRRISYSVMAAATGFDAFKSYYPRENCGSPVWGGNSASNQRMDYAVYTLVSHGKNGHGARLANGSIINAGSTNGAEQKNCRCTSTAAAAAFEATVDQPFYQNPASTTDTFDDLVRYKSRWQMQTPLDDRTFKDVSDVHMIVHYVSGGANYFTKECDMFKLAGNFDDLDGDIVSFSGFSSDNSVVFFYKEKASHCVAYTVSGTSFSSITEPTNCPQWNLDNAVALSKNGYLIITMPTSPYFRMWKLTGTTFTELNATFGDNALTSQPDRVAISPNGEHIVFSRTTATTYTRVYRRALDNRLYALASQPASMPAGATALAYSPDGRFLAASNSSSVSVWPYSNVTTYGAQATYAFPPGDPVASLAFSPDGNYIAAGNSLFSYNAIIKPVSIHKIVFNAAGAPSSFVEVSLINDFDSYTTEGPVKSLKFTRDSNYLMAVEASANDQPARAYLLKKVSDTEFRYSIGVDTFDKSGFETLGVELIN